VNVLIAAVGVIVAAGAIMTLMRRNKGASLAESLDSQSKARLEKELHRATVVETFEKSLGGDSPRAGQALQLLGQLDNEDRLRLSAEGLNLLGILLAQEGRHQEALNFLELSIERDANYFRTLNAAITFEVLRREQSHSQLPQYPFRYAQAIEVDASTLLRAQLLHNLDRPRDVEEVLTPGIAKPEYRYLRAECRRLNDQTKEALADYKELAKTHPDFGDVQQRIAELSGKPFTPAATAKVEKAATTSDRVAPVARPAATSDKVPPVARPAPTPEKEQPVAKAATTDRVAPVAKPAATSDRVPPVAKAAATSDRVPPVVKAVPPPGKDVPTGPPGSEATPPPPPTREPRRALATPQWNNDFDPRAVLGVGPSATVDEIRSAYLTLTKLHHPDRVATKGATQKAMAEEKMRDINRAWRELTREEAPTGT
jgi:tetratricopeptide (TPR) repeat protein